MIKEPDIVPEEVDTETELSLQPVLRTLWSYRGPMEIAFGLTLLCCVLAAVFLYAWAPKERLGTLGFELKFEGADRGQYPNGTTFSSAEIVSTPVLSQVYAANDLQRYTTFATFKDAVFVLQDNRALQLLAYEYTAKLADPKLGPVDRSRLEDEYNKKRESLGSAGYSLNLRRDERLLRIPDALLGKILQDVLSTWAKQAADNKGALRYNIPVLSKNALPKDFVTTEDYIVAADLLRSKVERVLKTVEAMAEIPGASALRMGADHIGLADLRVNLEDLNQFRLEPLISLIRASGITKNPVRVGEYYAGRLFEVQLAQTEAQQRLKSLQDALRSYEEPALPAPASAPQGSGAAVTPQLSESFIDKLVQMSTQSIDVTYRQGLTKQIIDQGIALADLNRQADYYQSMKRQFDSVHPAAAPAAAAEVTRQTNLAFSEATRLVDQVQAFYDQLSHENLNPDTVVYTVTSPFLVRTTPSLSLSATMLYAIVIMLIALLVIPLACLAHEYFRHWILPAPRHGSGTKPA